MAPVQTPGVRPSAIAGTWYPASAGSLRRTVEGYLNGVQPVALPGPALALVSPHAGYAYSGHIAAHAYAQVRGASFSRVVLLGPLHRPIYGVRLGPVMIPGEEYFWTPMGEVPVDREFVAALAEQVPLTPVQGDQEHSLEIQLPFLQLALAGAFSLVPILLGEYIGDPGAAPRLEALATALARLISRLDDGGTLLVASTDLSHMDYYGDVVRSDRALVEMVDQFDVSGLSTALRKGSAQACGAAGLVAALQAAQELGARGMTTLAYGCSGDITGDRRPGVYTVGYLAAAAYR